MPKPYDTRLIAMVSQEPFETPDLNQFCKLIPVVYVDGQRARPADFPNDGEIWWMLTAQTARVATPGRLVSASVEDARQYLESDPTMSRYQVRRDSIRSVDAKEGAEIIPVAPDAINSIEDIVDEFAIDLSIAPTPIVMIKWRSDVYGPFSASLETSSGIAATSRYTLSPANTTNMTVYRIAETEFDLATQGHREAVVADVSMTTKPCAESYQLSRVEHDLILGTGIERALSANATMLVLEPIDRKLIRYAKQCVSRRRRQELRAILDELDLKGREIEESEDLAAAIRRVLAITNKQDIALDIVAKALLDAGLLGEDRIAKAEETHAERYIQERTAELQAAIEDQIREKRSELGGVVHELKEVKERLSKQESKRRTEFEEQLASEKQEALWEMNAEQEILAKKKSELDRQEELLHQNLKAVTTDLRDAGDDVVNRFLTIAPLLGFFGLGQRGDGAAQSVESTEPSPALEQSFALPTFIPANRVGTVDRLSEDEFFTRFRSVVEDSGFAYRPVDLQRFHVSVKCGDITVLGGPSGTGKSSLPVLYAQALLGDDSESGRAGCLMVNINPSWMDTRDLLGHLNTIEGRFYPAESGLFQHLVMASEEYRASAELSAIYLTCLDEMNLSQIEHYFSDFMMSLERTGRSRSIQCFAPGVAGKKCPYRDWSSVRLSKALRFVGTVNFDETTRLLSDRFLDRANLIQLDSAVLPRVSGGDPVLASSSGRMVTLGDLETWCSNEAMPPDMGSLLDQLRPPLTQIGCPVSPRVYRAICRFVASAGAVLDDSRAFDIQLAQRVIPKIRSLITGRQVDALDELMRILDNSTLCAFDESLPLLDRIRQAAGSLAWDPEE